MPEQEKANSQKAAQEAYDTTKAAVTEQVAIALKKGGALKDLAKLGGQVIDLPKNDDEYRRIANELITTRKFKIKNSDGEEVEVSLANVDAMREALEKSTKEEDKENYKKISSALNGAKSFNELIPDNEKREKIAKAISKSVENNTGDIEFLGGASIMNAIMGLIKWVVCGFKDGFDGLKTAIANETANNISQDVGKNLSGLGLSQDIVTDIQKTSRSQALAKAGIADPDAKPAPTLAGTSTVREATPSPQNKTGAGQGNDAAAKSPAPAPAPAPDAQPPKGQKASGQKATDQKDIKPQPNGRGGREGQGKTSVAPEPNGQTTAQKPADDKSNAGNVIQANNVEKVVKNIAISVMTEGGRKKIVASLSQDKDEAEKQVTQASLDATTAALTEALKKDENKKLFAAGDYEGLSKKLSEELMKNPKTSRDILKYAEENSTAIQAMKLRVGKPAYIGGVSQEEYLKQATNLIKSNLTDKIEPVLSAKSGEIKEAMAKDAAAPVKQALNGYNLGGDATTLAMRSQQQAGAGATIG